MALTENSKTKKSDRTIQFQFWLTPAEKRELRLLAAHLDMSMSEALRHAYKTLAEAQRPDVADLIRQEMRGEAAADRAKAQR